MRDELNQLLLTLEQELRVQGRWETTPPADDALRSNQPFAVDKLSFDQWLQWIFLPRMRDLLLHQSALPNNCAIQPMAEEVYAEDDAGGAQLIAIIGDIDALLSGHQDALN